MITDHPPKQQSESKSLKNKFLVMTLGVILALMLVGFIYGWQKQKHLTAQMVALDNHLAVTKQAFISQINRRNELGNLLSTRFELKKEDSWEKRFYQLHDHMNEQELFLCQQTRAYTEGPMFESNQAMLGLLNDNPSIVAAVPLGQQLISHLTLWLNKYERVFKSSEKMCLLYVGVEDGAAYPSDFDQQVKSWIEKNQ